MILPCSPLISSSLWSGTVREVLGVKDSERFFSCSSSSFCRKVHGKVQKGKHFPVRKRGKFDFDHHFTFSTIFLAER